MAIPTRPGRTRKAIKRGPGQRIVEGKSFRLADEVRYIQRRAADRDGRIVTIGQLVLFSTEASSETGNNVFTEPLSVGQAHRIPVFLVYERMEDFFACRCP